MYYYTLRWKIETGFRDCKQSFGFDDYRVRSKKAIQRSVTLAFIAASLTQLMALPAFLNTHHHSQPEVKQALLEMNISWYHPKRWTLGLVVAYLRWQMKRQIYPASFVQNKNTQYITADPSYTYRNTAA